jgi:hypothetical protein
MIPKSGNRFSDKNMLKRKATPHRSSAAQVSPFSSAKKRAGEFRRALNESP